MMQSKPLAALFLLGVLAGLPQPGRAAPHAGSAVTAVPSPGEAMAPREVLAAAERLAKWQLAHMPTPMVLPPGIAPERAKLARISDASNPWSWHQGTFWLGMTALADASSAPWARQAILDHGKAGNWQPGPRMHHADDQLIGASYIWSANHGAGRQALQPLRERLDHILADPPRVHLAIVLGPDETRGHSQAEALKRWSWADALFMAPSVWLRLTRATGDRRYRDYALREFWATNDFLYDPAERLYFRDSRFFDKRDDKGRKVFWSRGNGWVIAGMAQMIDALPPGDPARRRLEDQFREFAGRIVTLQKEDGYWPSSLLTPEDSTPESSGTALFTYGLAWGVEKGLLPRGVYEPAVRRGWQALQRAIQPDGSLGWVQPAGDRPAPATASGTQVYATGAYLLAATTIANLDRTR